MSGALDRELSSLLSYFGEQPDAQDAPKPEDLFALVLTFSAALQKAALEVHDADVKAGVKTITPPVIVEEEPAVSGHAREETVRQSEGTLKGIAKDEGTGGLLPPPPPTPDSVGRRSVGRGQLDQTIRSMRDGRRRARPEREGRRPLSKMFFDGAPAGGSRASRVFDT